jgi:hypothetical protein
LAEVAEERLELVRLALLDLQTAITPIMLASQRLFEREDGRAERLGQEPIKTLSHREREEPPPQAVGG